MIAIKDFEMPNSYYDWELNNYHFCNITGNLIEKDRDGGTAANDCPLIEIKENEEWQEKN